MTTSQFGARSAFFVATGQRFAFAAKQRKKPTDLDWSRFNAKNGALRHFPV
jgi:hypothetical protein